MSEWVTLQEFAKQVQGVVTVSGLKAMAQHGSIGAQKAGARWLIDTSSPRAQALLAQAHDAPTADLREELEKAKHDLAVEEKISMRLLSENAELKKQLAIVNAKLEVALALSQTKSNKAKKPAVNWSERYREWSKTQRRPTVAGFAEHVGVPRTTMANRLKKEKENNK